MKVRTIQRRRHSKSQMRKDTHVCAQSLFPKMVKRRENQEWLDWKKDSLKKQLVKPGWCAFFLWIDKTQGMDPQGCQGGRRGNSVTAGETAEDRFPKQNLQIEFPFETPPSTYPYSYFHFFSNGGSCLGSDLVSFTYISNNTTPLTHCSKNHGIYLVYSQNVIL